MKLLSPDATPNSVQHPPIAP